MSNTNEKLTRLKHLVELGNRTKVELDALSEQIQEIVTVGGQPNVIEEIQVNGVKQTVTDKVINILMATKVSELENDAKYQSETEVAASIQNAIAATGHAHFEKVDAVPTVDTAEENVLYLVMNSKTNHYDIYAKVSGEVVRLDDTTVDLSAYSTTEQVNALISAAIEALKIGDYAKASDLTAAIKRIAAVEGKLAGIDTTVVAYVTSAINALNIGQYAKASELTALASRVTTIEGKVATWDAAEKNAKDYADGLNNAMNIRMEAVEDKAHTHSNKGVLDGITAAKVTAWDAAESNAKAYVDGMIAADADVTAALDAVFA